MVSGFNSRGRCAVRLAVLAAAVSVLFAIFAGSALATTVSVRIEGRTHTLFDRSITLRSIAMYDTDGAAHVESGNAMSVLGLASRLGGFPYELVNMWGMYINSIDAEQPVSTDDYYGWQYRVDHRDPGIGAADEVLQSGDDVLWYYGSFTPEPEAAVFVPAHYVAVGSTATVVAHQYDASGTASVLPTATVHVGSAVATAAIDGSFALKLTEAGDYAVRAEKPGVIRSAVEWLHVRYATSLSTLFVSKSSVKKGARTALYGTLVAKGASATGKTVVLMSRKKGSATWTRVASAKTGSGGGFRFVVKPASTRTYRVVFAGDSVLGDATGSPRTVTVH